MRRIVLPLILGIAGFAVLVSLGFWQLRRLEWKEAMLDEIARGIAAAPVELPAAIDPSMKYLPVTMTGTTTGDEILVLSGTREAGAATTSCPASSPTTAAGSWSTAGSSRRTTAARPARRCGCA